MQKLNLVKAIVRYNPSINPSEKFRYGNGKDGSSTRYLLLQKAIDAYFPENIGKWECIGGIIKPKGTSIETITRKITEETGLKKEKFQITKQLPTLRMTDKDYDSHCDVYLIDVSSMNVILSPEHSDYNWSKIEDIKIRPLVLYANLLLEFFNNPEKYLI